MPKLSRWRDIHQQLNLCPLDTEVLLKMCILTVLLLISDDTNLERAEMWRPSQGDVMKSCLCSADTLLTMSDQKELKKITGTKPICWHSQEEEAQFWHFSCTKLYPEAQQQPGSRLEGKLHRKRLDSTAQWHRRRMKMLHTSVQGSARRKEQCENLWSSDKVMKALSDTGKGLCYQHV